MIFLKAKFDGVKNIVFVGDGGVQQAIKLAKYTRAINIVHIHILKSNVPFERDYYSFKSKAYCV
jgi:hypothetical protein